MPNFIGLALQQVPDVKRGQLAHQLPDLRPKHCAKALEALNRQKSGLNAKLPDALLAITAIAVIGYDASRQTLSFFSKSFTVEQESQHLSQLSELLTIYKDLQYNVSLEDINNLQTRLLIHQIPCAPIWQNQAIQIPAQQQLSAQAWARCLALPLVKTDKLIDDAWTAYLDNSLQTLEIDCQQRALINFNSALTWLYCQNQLTESVYKHVKQSLNTEIKHNWPN